MKRLILPLLCLFVLASSSFAWMTLPVVGGCGGSCPPWYADANVVVAWDPNHPINSRTGCTPDGEPYTFSLFGAPTINADGINIVENNDYLKSPTSQAIVEWITPAAGKSQTMCAEVNISGQPAADVGIMGGNDAELNDIVGVRVNSVDATNFDLEVVWNTEDDAVINDYTEGALGYGDWRIVSYSWEDSGAEDYIQSSNVGDGTGWDDSADELKDMDEQCDFFYIGNAGIGDPAGATLKIRKFAIVDGYKFDCSTLTGW